MTEDHNCAICRVAFTGWGHNPSPFEGERCCDDCNARFVIPARLVPRRLKDEELNLLCFFANTGRMFSGVAKRAEAREAKETGVQIV